VHDEVYAFARERRAIVSDGVKGIVGGLGAPFEFDESKVIFGVNDCVQASDEGDSSEGISVPEFAVEKGEFYGNIVDCLMNAD
jgi:hypothetical protein